MEHTTSAAVFTFTDVNTILYNSESATVESSVSVTGPFPITEKGFCWEKINPATPDSKPDTNDNKTKTLDSSDGYFTGTLTNLSPDTRYRVRAYIKTSDDTPHFSDVLDFTTKVESATDERNIVYVKEGAAGDGSSWDNAKDLSTALAETVNGTEIWVAAGTYKPGTERTDSFQLKSGVAVYGGFSGTETDFNQRDAIANITRLSGDIGAGNDDTDNCYHVVIGSGADNTAKLDGFIIEGGNANGTSSPNNRGGGIYIQNGNPIVSGCTFSNNYTSNRGGGAYLESFDSTFSGCTFTNNSAAKNGGGAYITFSKMIFEDSTFSANDAVTSGGGIYLVSADISVFSSTLTANTAKNGSGLFARWYSTVDLTNCTFHENNASEAGGGVMLSDHSYGRITNCTIARNQSSQVDSGGGIDVVFQSMVSIMNTIIAENTSVDCNVKDSDLESFGFNIVEQGTQGSLDQFVSSDVTGKQTQLHLGELADNDGPTKTCALEIDSIAINTGGMRGAPYYDQRGAIRFDDLIDIGAFEKDALLEDAVRFLKILSGIDTDNPLLNSDEKITIKHAVNTLKALR